MREKGCGKQREHRPMRGDLKVRVRFYEFRLEACAFLHRHIQTSRRTAGEPEPNPGRSHVSTPAPKIL